METTGKIVYEVLRSGSPTVLGTYQTLRRATRNIDKRDMEYGGSVHYYRHVRIVTGVLPKVSPDFKKT